MLAHRSFVAGAPKRFCAPLKSASTRSVAMVRLIIRCCRWLQPHEAASLRFPPSASRPNCEANLYQNAPVVPVNHLLCQNARFCEAQHAENAAAQLRNPCVYLRPRAARWPAPGLAVLLNLYKPYYLWL